MLDTIVYLKKCKNVAIKFGFLLLGKQFRLLKTGLLVSLNSQSFGDYDYQVSCETPTPKKHYCWEHIAFLSTSDCKYLLQKHINSSCEW